LTFGPQRLLVALRRAGLNQLRRGEDALNIKTIAGWKSDRMLERYVGESKVVLAEEAYRRIGDPADRPAAKTVRASC
jgi:hypothetical protein